jgi:hypothetical protein
VINTFEEIARVIVELLPILLGFLGYATTIRAFIAKKYGKYRLGLIDGFFVSLIGMAIILYIQSFFA